MAARTTGPGESTPTHGLTIVGIFTDRSEAERAIQDLKAAGFTEEEIGVAMLDRNEQRQLIDETGSTTAGAAATGALSGGVIGGLIGLLGSLLLPGAGPLVVGGVLASTLAGVGIGAAAGGLIGALMGMGVPEADARHFDTGLRSGAVLVTVNAGDRLPEALALLERHGMDLGPSRGERFRTTATGAATGAPGRQQSLGDEPVVVEEEEILVVEREPATGRTTRSYKGKERRRRQEASYSGPERRELFL